MNSHFGIIDIAGFPKDSFFYYKSQWRADLSGAKSVVHMLPHWNWGNPAKCAGLCHSVYSNSTGAKATSVDVWAYGGPDIASLDLVVNGKTVAAKTSLPKQGHVEWKAVPYEPGTATCNGYDANGKLLSSHVVKTAHAPVAITATIEQGSQGVYADKDDVILVKLAVVDAAGTTHPTADNMITFTVTGPGVVIGVGNGDPSSHEPDKAMQRSAWNGLARVVVQTTDKPGSITITASSPGLKSASVTVSSKAPPHRLAYV